MKRTITFLCTAIITVSAITANAADIPVESYPDNATDESVAITQNLIGGILLVISLLGARQITPYSPPYLQMKQAVTVMRI